MTTGTCVLNGINPIDVDLYSKPGPLDAESAAIWTEILKPAPKEDQLEALILDKFNQPLGEIVGYEALTWEWVWNAVGTASFTIPADHDWAKLVMSIDRTVVPIVITYNGKRWSGRINKSTRTGITRDKKITCELISDYAWFHAILAYPQPLSIPEIQFPPQDIMIAGVRTLVAWYTIRNAFRIGLPITFMPYTLLRDTTPVRVGMARMVPLDELFEQWLKDTGCHLTITLWMPGDKQPHPDLFLTKPQYIVDVVQQPRTGGLLNTGTVLDGIADTIGNLIAAGVNLFTGWLNPGIGQAISDALTSDEMPRVVFRSDGSAIDDATVTVTHPLYYSAVIGGKSPTWVNKLIDLGVQMAITWIFSLLSLAVIPGLAAFISGMFHDVFLAFQKFVDWSLKQDLGPLGFPEGFVNAGAAYTFSGFQAGTKGLYDGRGTRSASITLRDGYPYTAFVDYDLGVLAGWEDEDDGEIYYDRITSIRGEHTREGGIVLKTVIGDDKADEAPWEVGMRQIKELFSVTNFLAVN
ncbi:hypothetical protein [Rhodococcus sp. NPDC127528]|uniref:Gp37-like protein n=1 Tax=unclassified Rhodococcus (in: high G+C Gram-positive bacteria) TaxID=192944 RepID=UPI00363DD9A4